MQIRACIDSGGCSSRLSSIYTRNSLRRSEIQKFSWGGGGGGGLDPLADALRTL